MTVKVIHSQVDADYKCGYRVLQSTRRPTDLSFNVKRDFSLVEWWYIAENYFGTVQESLSFEQLNKIRRPLFRSDIAF
jgi:hypothetical protein